MSSNSSSDSLERLLSLADDNTPARTGLPRPGRRSSVSDLVRKLTSLGISGSPCAPTSTPAKAPMQASGSQDSEESSFAEDAEGPNTSGLERLKRRLEERCHMDFSIRGRRSFNDEAVGVILEHVDQPGRNLEADVDELCRMRTPLSNRRMRRSYFADSPVQAEAGSPCPELDDSMDEENCSLLDRTATFISTYTWIVMKARRSLNTRMSQQEKIENVRRSLDQGFRDMVTQDKKERILESCIQRIDDLAVDDEEIDANNNDVEKLETSPQQHRGAECIILPDSPYVKGKICEARQDPDPRPGESSEGSSEEVVLLDISDCLSIYADSSFLDLSSEQSKEDSCDSEPVEIAVDFRGSALKDETHQTRLPRRKDQSLDWTKRIRG